MVMTKLRMGRGQSFQALHDPARDQRRVAADADECGRRQAALKRETDEIQAGHRRDAAGLVQRVAVGRNDRQVHPAEVQAESAAPQDGADVEDAPIFRLLKLF
jgi:hypothetical protein